MTEIILTPKQSLIYRDQSRFKVVICGRRFGKTYLALSWLSDGAISLPGSINTYYAPNQTDAREISWELLHELIPERFGKFNEQRLELKFRNNSIIKLRGTDKKLGRGGKNHRLVYDEFAFGSQDKYEKAISPTLADTEGEAMFISSPDGRNWGYDYYLRGLDHTFNEWSSYQFTTIDGGNVTPEEVEKKRRELPLRTFRQEYLATFEEAIGRIIYAFQRDIHVKDYKGKTPEQIWVGMDFNVNPMSAVIAVFEAGIIYYIDEIFIQHSNTTEMCQEIKKRYPDKLVNVCPDPSGKARKTSAGGQTDFTIIESFGFRVHAPNAHQNVDDRHNETNAAFMNAADEVRSYVNSNCQYFIKCLEGHTYKEGKTHENGTSIPNKNDGFDHGIDACGYLAHVLMPMYKPSVGRIRGGF